MQLEVLSVIMPARNAAAFIAEAIRSIAVDLEIQTELVVVDDGSTDATAEIVRGLAFKNLVIKIFPGNQRGVANARNVGLANTNPQTAYILFLDSDDVIPRGKIIRQLAFLQENPKHLAIFGQIQYFDVLDSETLQPKSDARTVIFRGIQMGSGLMRRQFFQTVGQFDEGFEQGEDSDLYFRAHELSCPIHYEDDVGIYYRRHANNMTNDRPAARSGFMKCIQKSIQRRLKDKNLRSLDSTRLSKGDVV